MGAASEVSIQSSYLCGKTRARKQGWTYWANQATLWMRIAARVRIMTLLSNRQMKMETMGLLMKTKTRLNQIRTRRRDLIQKY